jgi:hypothetical protein
MTHFKRKPLLSLLLALVMVVTMLPMSAWRQKKRTSLQPRSAPTNTVPHEHESAETQMFILFSLIPNKPGLPRILL